MTGTSAATFVKKTVGLSIGLSMLMIVAGIFAIASPLAAGIAVNLLVAWLLVFSGFAHLAFAWPQAKRRRISLGVAAGNSLPFHRGISDHTSTGRLGVTDHCPGDLSIHGG